MALIDDVKTYIRGTYMPGTVEEEKRIDKIIERLKVRLDRDGVIVDWNSSVIDAKSYVYRNFAWYLRNLR